MFIALETFYLQEPFVVPLDVDGVAVEFDNSVSGNVGASWLDNALQDRLDWLKLEKISESKSDKDQQSFQLEIYFRWSDMENPPRIKV